MAILVAVETFVLILLALLVAGLLRSHAEILRQLPSGERPAEASGDHGISLPTVTAPPRDLEPAPDVVGTTLDGDAVKVAVSAGGGGTLLAFMSSGCATCRAFWDAFQPEVRRPVPGDARLVVVTRDSAMESPSKLHELAPPDLPVVLSSAAWDAYQVPLTPYFVYVDGTTGRVAGEGAAEAWSQIVSLVRDALADAEATASAGRRPVSDGRGRMARAEHELEAAGIGPDHPSLYQAGDPMAGS